MPFNPIDYPAVFLEPVILNLNSAWIEHIPFAFTLIQMLQPRSVVELGVHAGDSYCSFCKAVKHLALPTECFGIDTWQGDAHAGIYGENVLPALRSHHDPKYASFSKLLQMEFDAAVMQFKPGSIDLLHIDGLHTYEAVKHDFEIWLPRMSESGVVLFHDTVIRRDDFGVFQLWAELAQRYPHFHFEHGSGLGVLAVGTHVPQGLRSIFDSTPEQARAIGDFYARLGREIDLRRYYSGVMHQVFNMQSLINQWKQQVSQPISDQSQSLQFALANGIIFVQDTMQDVHSMATNDLKIRSQTDGAGTAN